MNIFKILANGGGSINETNVSAFIGYLLDPKADHGLGFEFISRFLRSNVEEDFKFELYDYEIFYEQAFQEKGNKKEIVDIVVVCYSINRGDKQQSLVKAFLQNTKKPERIFLIENKIKTSSFTKGQLANQFTSAYQEVSEVEKNKIHSIYLTPKHKSLDEDFLASKLKNSSQVYWNQEQDSVKSILSEVLDDEARGVIEPLSEYTLHTIKAFCQFIESNFKSHKEEEKERKQDYSYTNKCIELNEASGIEEKLNRLKTELLNLDSALSISEPNLNRICEPELFVDYKGIAISLYAGHKSRNSIMLIYRVHEERKLLDKLADKLNLDIKKANYGDSAYCKEEWMKDKLPIENYEAIYESIQNAFKRINQN